MAPDDNKDKLYGIFSIVGCIIMLIVCIFITPFKISISLSFIAATVIVFSYILIPKKIEKTNLERWKQKEDFWKKIYEQTQQQPELANYGRSIDNPIWAGTPNFYFYHLCTDDEICVTWKFSKTIKREKKNDFYCHLAKYDVYANSKYIDSFYLCTASGLDEMRIWHAPKGYKFR